MLHFSELLLPSENEGLLKCYNGVIKVFPLSSGCQCGQSTHPPLRFSISLAKKCTYISLKSHLGATMFPASLLTTLPILDFDISSLLLEDKNVSPVALAASEQNHHCTSVPVRSPQIWRRSSLQPSTFENTAVCTADQKARPSDPLHVCGGSALHLRPLLWSHRWLTVWLALHPNLF